MTKLDASVMLPVSSCLLVAPLPDDFATFVSSLVRGRSRLEANMPKYKVLVPLSYPPDRLVDAGEIVDDLPAKSVKWLVEQNLVEAVGAKTVVETDDSPVAEV